jgi:hypothetical protein
MAKSFLQREIVDRNGEERRICSRHLREKVSIAAASIARLLYHFMALLRCLWTLFSAAFGKKT